MEEINNFAKGVNYDSSIIQQPQNTATILQNWVQISDRGYMFSLQNEKGPLEITTDIPLGFKVMGGTVLENDIILCLAHPNGYSQIGIIDYSNTYTRVVPEPNDPLGDTNIELGLSVNFPVDCTSRKLIRGNRILYYTDNNTPFAAIDLDQTYVTGDIKDNVKLIPNTTTAVINFEGIIENQGSNLTAGVYQFLIQYQTASSNWTIPGIPTNIIPVVPPTRSVGRDKYEGGSSTTLTNKGISLNITNIDQSFTSFRIVAIRYDGLTNTFNASTSSPIPITSATYQKIYNGDKDSSTILTKEEVSEFGITYTTAKTIEQKDQTLILSNLSEASASYDHTMQDIANNITVKYKITEQEYLEGTDLTPSFGIEGFYIENEADLTFYGLFNQAVGASPNIVITVPALQATDNITITSFSDLAGDTLNINGTLFTAISTVPTPGVAEFQYSVDNATTAKSLADQVNAYTFSPRVITASTIGNLVHLIDAATGTAGNSNTLVYNNVGTVGLTIASATFTGGTNSRTIVPLSYSVDVDNNYQYIIIAPEVIYSSYVVYVNLVTSAGGSTYTTPLGTYETITNGELNINEDSLKVGISNYKNEANTFDKKGYRRSEKYSLGITGELTTGTYTLNYHIPGNNKTASSPAIPDSPGTVIGNTEGICGTYVSDLEYPFNQFYPGNLTGDDTSSGRTSRKIIHHVMPSLQQEPSFRRDTLTGKTYIRILSLKIVFNKAFPQTLIDAFQAYYITRQSRDSDNNTSVYAQGMYNRFINNTLDYSSSNATADGTVYKRKMFGFNNGAVTMWDYNFPGSAGIKPSAGFIVNTPTTKTGMFISPDLLFGRISSPNIQGLNIRAELRLKGNPVTVDFKPSVYSMKNVVVRSETKLSKYPKYWAAVDYKNYEPVVAEVGNLTDTVIVEAKSIEYGTNTTVASFSETLYNEYSEQGTFISTVDNLNLGIDSGGPALNLHIKATVIGRATNSGGVGEVDYNSLDYYNLNNVVYNNIYNIYSNNASQYGTVSSALYIPVKRVPVNSVSYPTIGSSVQVYGGDTFISRFAYSTKDNIQFKPFKFIFYLGTPISTTNYEFNGSGQNGTMVDGQGYDIRTLQYFFVESNINCEYRHQYVDPTTFAVGPTFYPKGSVTETLTTDPRVGEPSSYNTQYSFENKVKYFINKSFDFKTQGRYATRSIYSEKSNLDDITDYYKEFPINNFHDIPSNTGEIWDSFVFDNILYFHTPKALWRTYFNNNTFIAATNVSEVVLGTGKEFSRPSETVLTTKGGYAGTISQYGGTITSFGYVFVDALQGKVFLLAGGLSELSDAGTITFFKNIGDSLKLGDSYQDNPFTKDGIVTTYDTDLRRVLITKTNTGQAVEVDNAFTISYSLLSQSWMGTHTYHPSIYINRDKDTYVFYNHGVVSKFYQLNKGTPGVYFNGQVYPSIIEFDVTTGYDVSKVFTNLIIENQVLENNKNKVETFTNIQAYNDFQNTSILPISINNTVVPNYNPNLVEAKYYNKEYRIRLPRDIVIDPNDDIQDPSNLNPLIPLKKKLKGKWLKIRLEYNNVGGKDFILNFVKSIFDQNFR